MKNVLATLSLLVVAFAAPASASADTACFDWSCDSSTGICTFDFSCSSASPFIWKYNMHFGDGTSTGLTGTTLKVKDYGMNSWWFNVTLTIYPWSDNGNTSVSCEIIVRNFIGPPLPTSGRCTS